MFSLKVGGEIIALRDESRTMNMIESAPFGKYGVYDYESEIKYVNPWDATRKDEVKTI